MGQVIRRFRGLAIAFVVLALSAGAVLAGGGPPPAADFGLEQATEASGHSVPVRAGVDEDSDPAEEDVEEPTADEEPVDEELDEELDEGSDNHGSLVSEAARMEDPDGFGNHGAFVSCVARMNRGQLDDEELEALAELDLGTLTPEDCEADEAAAEDGDEVGEPVEDADDGPGKSGAAPGRNAQSNGVGASGRGRGRG